MTVAENRSGKGLRDANERGEINGRDLQNTTKCEPQTTQLTLSQHRVGKTGYNILTKYENNKSKKHYILPLGNATRNKKKVDSRTDNKRGTEVKDFF